MYAKLIARKTSLNNFLIIITQKTEFHMHQYGIKTPKKIISFLILNLAK